MEAKKTGNQAVGSTEQRKAVRIMANSMFRQFVSSGYSQSQIIDFTSELLELVTDSIRPETAKQDVAANFQQLEEVR